MRTLDFDLTPEGVKEMVQVAFLLRNADVTEDPDRCWEWQGTLDKDGYPRCYPPGRDDAHMRAHRRSHELLVGPIPLGYEVDHLCQNILCVNPRHLEAVTKAENRRRVDARRTHCRNGHAYTPDNTSYTSLGHRQCRVCRGASLQRYAERRAA